MVSEQSRAIGFRFADLFNNHDLSIADEIFGQNFRSALPQAAPPLDKESWKAYIQVFFTGFPDIRQDIEDMIATDNRLVLQLMYHGTHTGDFQGIPPTGKSISIRAIGVNRIENGFIVENTVVLDMLSVMQQIGVIPMPG